MALRLYSSRDVGKLVGADPSSVNRWIDSGKLKAFRTPGGHRRVLHDDLLDFLDQCGMPTPRELLAEGKKVLIVDGDARFLRQMRRALLRLSGSLEIDTCESGVEALIRIGADPPDVVLLDPLMPGIDGVEVCSRIKGNPATAKTTVVAIAGKSSPTTERKMREAGADRYVLKPIKAPELLALIQPPRERARG